MSATTAFSNSQRRRAVGVRLLAVVASLLLVSLLVINNSRAAFTDTTEPAQGSWSTSNVSITRDRGATLFAVTGMVPGDATTEDVLVTYDGTAPSVDIRLYGEGFSDPDGLADFLNLTVTADDGGTPVAVFDGTLAEFQDGTEGGHLDFDTGADTWNDAGPNDERTYTITVELDEGATNDQEGQSASLSFVWEARSNVTRS
jgi:hypothetical protein